MYKEIIVSIVVIITFYIASRFFQREEDEGADIVFFIVSGVILVCTMIVGAIYSDYIIYYINAIPFLYHFIELRRFAKPFVGGGNMMGGNMMGGSSGGGGYSEDKYGGNPLDFNLSNDIEDNISVSSDDIRNVFY